MPETNGNAASLASRIRSRACIQTAERLPSERRLLAQYRLWTRPRKIVVIQDIRVAERSVIRRRKRGPRRRRLVGAGSARRGRQFPTVPRTVSKCARKG